MRYIIVVYRIYIVMLLLALAFPVKVRAQYDVSFSHYFDMETSFNPAAAGKESKINVTAAYAMDLAGFEHNPQTAYISGDMPFRFMNGTHATGLQLINDKLGLFNHMRLSVQYSPKVKLFGGLLGIGVQAGLISETFNGSELDIDQDNDDAFIKSEADGHALDIGAGLYYTYKSFYVGASVLHVTSPKVEIGETSELEITPTCYLTAGYTINLRNPMLKIKTSALGRTDFTGYRADVTARLVYENDSKKMYGGLSYSPTNSVTALVGINLHGINVGYSYECYTNGINPGNGSHELFVGYQIDMNLIKKGKNRHQSVRIL